MKHANPEMRKGNMIGVTFTKEQAERVAAERIRRAELAGVEVSKAMLLRRLIEERLDAIDAELAGNQQ